MESRAQKGERIDIRVSLEEKKMFQRAYKLSGDKTFSGFITRIVKFSSKQIIETHERILASERDKKIFFNALFSDVEPNQELTNAARKYKLAQESEG